MQGLKSISQYRMSQNVRNHAVMHILGNDETCAICRETFNDNEEYSRCTTCNYPFHLTCITNWFSHANRCPSCNHTPAHFTAVYRVGNNNRGLPLGPGLAAVNAPVVNAPVLHAQQNPILLNGPLGQFNALDAMNNLNMGIFVTGCIMLISYSFRLQLLRGGGSLNNTNKLKEMRDLEAEVMRQIKHSPNIKIESILKLSLNELIQLLKDMGVSDTTISKITNINTRTTNHKTRNSNRRVNRVSARNRTLRNS